MMRWGPDAFHAQLAQRDLFAAARISPGDRQRLVRAWEVHAATGRPLTDWQKDRTQPLIGMPKHKIVIEPDRDWLYARINLRFDRMVEAGAVEEARALADRELSQRLPAMRALGVPQFMDFLAGNLDLDEAVEAAKTATRRYAKRQMTWFRNQMITWKRVFAQDSESLKTDIFNIILK